MAMQAASFQTHALRLPVRILARSPLCIRNIAASRVALLNRSIAAHLASRAGAPAPAPGSSIVVDQFWLITQLALGQLSPDCNVTLEQLQSGAVSIDSLKPGDVQLLDGWHRAHAMQEALADTTASSEQYKHCLEYTYVFIVPAGEDWTLLKAYQYRINTCSDFMQKMLVSEKVHLAEQVLQITERDRDRALRELELVTGTTSS
jgi:hypothetical protein